MHTSNVQYCWHLQSPQAIITILIYHVVRILYLKVIIELQRSWPLGNTDRQFSPFSGILQTKQLNRENNRLIDNENNFVVLVLTTVCNDYKFNLI